MLPTALWQNLTCIKSDTDRVRIQKMLFAFYIFFDLSRFLIEPKSRLLSCLLLLDVLLFFMPPTPYLSNLWIALRIVSYSRIIYRRLIQ